MKPKCLRPGDKVAIVSLSSGIMGEPFAKHEVEIAERRLKEYGLVPVYMKYSMKGAKYLANHPKQRAKDLKQAFADPSIKGIICAIGGTDTYKLTPYLLEDKKFVKNVIDNPKIFTGFSDTTVNHLVLNKLGLNTYYGPCYLCDLAEFEDEMLPYTKEWFEIFLAKEKDEIKSSDVWYKERTSFAPSEVGTPRFKVKETKGFEVIQGKGKKTGRLFGGCIESIYELAFGITARREICNKYKLLPEDEEYKGKILFLETSEEKPSPDKLEEMLRALGSKGMFDYAEGIIVGKPQDEMFYDEYKEVYKKVLGDKNIPIMFNVNFGHAFPRCVIPYNVETTVDYTKKTIKFNERLFD